jgi:hypothetical protein
MATMTIVEAEHIIDILAKALMENGPLRFYNVEHKSSHMWRCYKPISTLQGYDVFQIDKALKLRIANMFLHLSRRNDFEEQFAKEIGICTLPTHCLEDFLPDDLMAKTEHLAKSSKTISREKFEHCQLSVLKEIIAHNEWFITDKKFLSRESSESFGNYCKSLGADDPLFWQKIYTRIGLPYSGDAPQQNHPVYTENEYYGI